MEAYLRVVQEADGANLVADVPREGVPIQTEHLRKGLQQRDAEPLLPIEELAQDVLELR